MKRLKSKVADKCKDMGLSENAIEALINSMGAGIDGESTDEEVEECASKIADVAKAMQGEATRWASKAKKDAKQSKKAEEEGDGGSDPKDLAATISQAVAAAVQPIADRLAKVEGAAITGARRSMIEKELEGAPAMVRKLALANFDSKTFEKDEDFTAFLEGVKTDMADYRKEVNSDGLRKQSAPLFGKNNEEGVPEAVANYVKRPAEGASDLGGKKL